MRVRPYTPADASIWDDLVERSWNGTFLHSRSYLSYAEDRHTDASLVVEDGRSPVAVFPAAVHAADREMIESHPAIGFGGLVHDGSLRGSRMLAALEAVAERYYHDGMSSLRYKPTPLAYHRVPSADDLYALFRLGALRSRCDLASVIDLERRPAPSTRRRRGLRKAERAGVQVATGVERLGQLWPVLTGRLATKYGAEPIHTLPELQRLAGAFTGRIDCTVGLLDGRVIAGIVLFRTDTVDHAQYIAADDRGYKFSALDLVFARSIERSVEAGTRYFGFGNSTLYGGRIFSEGLFEFKSAFGAGTIAHECYDLALA